MQGEGAYLKRLQLQQAQMSYNSAFQNVRAVLGSNLVREPYVNHI